MDATAKRGKLRAYGLVIPLLFVTGIAGAGTPSPFDGRVELRSFDAPWRAARPGVAADACGWLESATHALDPGPYDYWFGYSTAVDGDTMVVGAFRVDGRAGAAYVFERNLGGPNAWGLARKISAPADDAPFAEFGVSVAIDGDTIVVGAHLDREGSFLHFSGSAHVFDRNAGGPNNWGRVVKLTGGDGVFGRRVAIDADTIVVGAIGDSRVVRIGGSAQVFRRDVGGPDHWGLVADLFPDDAVPFDRFGSAVAIDATTIAVGAYDADAAGDRSGAAYVFERDAGGAEQWGQVAKLVPSDGAPQDQFGQSIGVEGDTVVVGALGADTIAEDAGAAYVFERSGAGASDWVEMTKLTPPGAAEGDQAGWSIGIRGDRIAVGSFPGLALSGGVEVFERDGGGGWTAVAPLIPTDPNPFDGFGYSIGIDGNTIASGAPFSPGYPYPWVGAVHVFDFSCSDCGNGIEELPEACDDGNTVDGDGCSADCAIEGACCTGDDGGVCGLQSEDACSSAGGRYFGDGEPCGTFTCTPLLVTIESMGATATPEGVLLEWTTALEVDTVGFRVLRQRPGNREKSLEVLADRIPAAGSPVSGASYRFLDNARQPVAGVRYFIEDVDLYGRVTRHGPIVVVEARRGDF